MEEQEEEEGWITRPYNILEDIEGASGGSKALISASGELEFHSQGAARARGRERYAVPVAKVL